jgi:hypothetical protein
MKKLFLTILAILFLAPLAYGGSGLTRGDQTIYGHKTFENNITVQGTLIANGPTTGLTDVGNVWYVGSTDGLDGGNYGTKWDTPFATIDYAIGRCTADKACVIYVLPFHAETVTSAITVDVAGVSIIGIPRGRNLPTITANGTIDAITVTAADVMIANLRFAAPGTDAQTSDINIAAARVTVQNTVHIGSDTGDDKVDIITITAAGHDFLLDGLRIYNSVQEGAGGAISIEGAAARGEIRNCFIMDTIGYANGALYDGAAATALYVHDNVFSNAKADTVVLNYGNNSTGVTMNNFVAGRHSTLASNIAEGTSMNFHENYHVEEDTFTSVLAQSPDTD